MQYRFTLGRQTTGSDLANMPGTAGVWSDQLTQGKTYQVSFEKTGERAIKTAVGAIPVYGFVGIEGLITLDRLCVAGSELNIASNVVGTSVSNVSCYELSWNTPLENDPDGWDAIEREFVRDKVLNGLVRKTVSDLYFWGDGYTYLLERFNNALECSDVPILVERREKPNDAFTPYFEGVIDVTDAEFDFKRCTAKCNINEVDVLQRVLKNREVIVPNALDGYRIFELSPVRLHLSDGTPTPDNFPCFRAFNVLKGLIYQATDGNCNVVSDYFNSNVDPYYGGSISPFHFCLMHAVVLENYPGIYDDISLLEMSFNEFFAEMDKIFNLSFSIEIVNGIPEFRLEPKLYYQNNTPSVSLDKIPDFVTKSNKEALYKSVRVGYRTVYYEYQNTSNFKDEIKEGVQYITELGCRGNELNLVSKWIQDYRLIWAHLPGGGNTLTGGTMIIEAVPLSGSTFQAVQYSVGSGLYGYNPETRPEDNMRRHAISLQATTYVNSTGDSIIANGSPAKTKIYKFMAPVSEQDFEILSVPGQSLQISGAGIPTPINCDILSVKRSEKTCIAQFEVLGQ